MSLIGRGHRPHCKFFFSSFCFIPTQLTTQSHRIPKWWKFLLQIVTWWSRKKKGRKRRITVGPLNEKWNRLPFSCYCILRSCFLHVCLQVAWTADLAVRLLSLALGVFLKLTNDNVWVFEHIRCVLCFKLVVRGRGSVFQFSPLASSTPPPSFSLLSIWLNEWHIGFHAYPS